MDVCKVFKKLSGMVNLRYFLTPKEYQCLYDHIHATPAEVPKPKKKAAAKKVS